LTRKKPPKKNRKPRANLPPRSDGQAGAPADRAPDGAPADHHSQAKIICIFGKRGSGKSTLAKKFLRGKKRVIVFDPLGEYDGERFENLGALLRHVRSRARFFAVFRPRDARAEFPWLARIAYEVGSLCLVAEEISWAISPAKMPVEIETLIRYGRHRDVELVGISRRPAEVNRDLTSNANEVYIFRTHEPRDLEYFRKVIGSAADGLPNLPPYVPHVWKDEIPEIAPQ